MDWDAIEDRTRELVVSSHWDSPAEIISACANQFRTDRWANQDVHAECFPPETPVQTPGGYVAIGALQVGDQVVSGRGAPHTVERVFRKTYAGDLIQIEAAGLLPFMCTPEHPLWAQTPDPRYPKAKGAERKFSLPAYLPAQEVGHFSLLRVPLNKTTKAVTSVRLSPGSRSFDPGSIPVTNEFLTMLGFYLAEGCVKSDERTVQFTFAQDEVTFAEGVASWATSVGFNPFIREGKGTCIVYVCGKALAAWLTKNFGSGSRNKRLPRWCLDLPQAQQLVMLRAYVQGDGHWADPSRSAVTVGSFSSELAMGVQAVLLRCGYAAAVYQVTDHDWPRTQVTVGGASGVDLAAHWGFELNPKGRGRSRRYNHIKLDEDYAYFPVRKVSKVPYHGDVCNLEVAEDHTYCVPVEAHNCWIEKEALSGVFERICKSMDVGCFACRGYTSQSEMWGAAQRFVRHIRNGKNVVILHFGDHDPSGIDMTRDIEDRIRMFARHHVGTKADSMIEIRRLALNMDQVNLYNPPENPAKVTDSRFASYEAVYGDKSWELDALNPRTLTKLVRDNVMAVADRSLWDDIIQTEAEARGQLATLHAEYSNVIARIEDDVELNDTMNDRINDAKDDILTEMGVGSEGDDDETGDDSDGGEDE